MLAIKIKKFSASDDEPVGWVIIDSNERGFSDVLELTRLANVIYRHNPISRRFKTKKMAQAALELVAAMASQRTGGAFDFV